MSVRATSGSAINVRVALYDVATLRARWPAWEQLSKAERLERARKARPERVVEDRNTTTNGLHQVVVDHLDSEQSSSAEATHLAVGNDDSTSPSSSDTALNNEVYRVGITDSDDKGTELFTSTFLDTSEANGYTLKEVGLFTASSGGTLLNHSLIADIVKTDTKVATIDVTLSFSPA